MSTPTTTQPPRSFKMLTMNVRCYSETKKQVANGRGIKSDALIAGGHSWRIAFYPNGRLATTAGAVSVFLMMDDAGALDDDVHVEFKLMLQEVGGGGPPRHVSRKLTGAFSCRQAAGLGLERFLSHEDLEKSACFKHDRFTIRCDFAVLPPCTGSEPTTVDVGPAPSSRLPDPSATMAPPPPPTPESSRFGLHADLGRLLETKEGADVEFEVCGQVFAAHKLMLAARSPVFKADFFGPMKEEATSYVRICDMHPEAFEALLHYIYTDSLPEMPLNSREGTVLAEGLLLAADRYDLKDLKLLAESKMCKHIGVSTVLPMLALAEQHQCCKLKRRCIGFIASQRNTRAIVATDQIGKLARSGARPSLRK